MDPVTHTLTGWSLGRAGVRHVTPLAVPTLVIAANAPDLDALAYLEGEYVALAFRRGWTHGILAWVVLPLLVAGLVLAFDRLVRRNLLTDAAPVRGGPLLAVAALGVLTHPFLDWLNTYGIRLLMPFDDRWFYGDALFIVDPWLWLLLAGGLFLGGPGERLVGAGWALFWVAAAALLWWSSPRVPLWAPLAWIAAAPLLLALRSALLRRGRRRRAKRARDALVPSTSAGPGGTSAGTAAASAAEPPPLPERGTAGWPVRVGLALATLYVGGMIYLSARSGARVEAALEGPREVMVEPLPADPLRRGFIVASPDGYRFGEERVGGGLEMEPGLLRRTSGPELPAGSLEHADVARYLVWARFPVIEVAEAPGGPLLRVGDARHPHEAGGLSGVTVRLAPATPRSMLPR